MYFPLDDFCSYLVSDSDIKDAHALYDFQGRTERELSFKKGDSLILFEKVSTDWWEGAVGDREGLIPDKYIQVGPRLVTRISSSFSWYLSKWSVVQDEMFN